MKYNSIFITDQFMTGGVESVFLNISRYVKKKIILIPLHTRYNKNLIREIPKNVKIVSDLPKISRGLNGFIKIPFIAFRQKKLRKINERDRVINFSDTLSSLLFAYILNPNNCISWIHCNPKALLKSKSSKLYFYLLSKCKQLVFVSESQRQLFFSLPESQKIKYKRSIVCTNFFNKEEILGKSKQKINIQKDSYFFTAARLDFRSKDYITLIDGYDRLPSSIKDKYLLIIAGSGPDKGKVEKVILEKKLRRKVLLIGNQDNVYKYMSKAKLYIHSSISEGFSMSILEALECGATVISADCEVGPREILENEKYGYLYQVKNAKQLASKIEEALKKTIPESDTIKRAEQISSKGMKEIRSFFNE